MSEKTYYDQYWMEGRNSDCPHVEWKKKILLAELKVQPHHVLYDFGCGTGEISSGFTSKCRVYGSDISSEAMEAAASKGIKPVEDYSGNFDVALVLDVLEHLFDPVQTLKAILDRVNRGGDVFISVPNGVNLYNRMTFLLGAPVDINDKAHKYDDLWSEHIRVFNLGILRNMCCQNGLAILKEWYYFPQKLSEKSGLLYSIPLKVTNSLKLHQIMPSLMALGFMVRCSKR